MQKSTEQTIFEMLTENTGRSILDSGGAYGRNFERNAELTIDDFRDQPSAWLEIWSNDAGADLTPTVSVFHACCGALELDSLCHEFNSLECSHENHNGDYYGTDSGQCDWLEDHGFSPVGEAFNTYNWNSNHSQILQGQELECDQEKYVLLQIHGGCDARGGYTDARLFKLSSGDIMSLLLDHCGFSVETEDGEYLTLNWHGEWVDGDGSLADDDYMLRFARACGERRTLPGDFYAYN